VHNVEHFGYGRPKSGGTVSLLPSREREGGEGREEVSLDREKKKKLEE